jgi:hypothetical protein
MPDTALTIDRIISRLEAAPEGSRELGYEVLLASGWSHVKNPTSKDGMGALYAKRIKKPNGWIINYADAPNPTRSLDAALTLVPEGLEFSIERRHSKGMRPAYASIWSTGARDVDFHANGDAATIELALCIAALKAQEHSVRLTPP